MQAAMSAAFIPLPRLQRCNIAAPIPSSSLQASKQLRIAQKFCFSSLTQGCESKSRGRISATMSGAAPAAAPEIITTPMGLQVQELQDDGSEHTRIQVKVRVPGKLCKQVYDDTIRKLGKKVNAKGFSGGKVPEWVLLKRLGQKRVEAEVIKKILEKTLPEAMAPVADRALKDSEELVTRFESLLAAFTPSSPLSYTVAVDVMPEVRWTSEEAYKHLKISVEARDASTAQNAAEAELLARHKDLGSLRVVVGRGLQMKDVAIIDISAYQINEDGSLGDQISSCTQKGFSLDTEETLYVPGLVDNMIGQNAGESRTFDLVFPADWEQEELRNIKARFTIECKEIFLRLLPELDDEIAEKLEEGCKSLDEVKEKLIQKYRLMDEKSRKNNAKSAILNELPKIINIEVPKSLIQEQGRQLYASRLMEMHIKQRLDKSQMESLTDEDVVNNFIATKEQEIAAIVKQSIAVAEIFKLEKLQYSEEELEAEMKYAVAEFNRYNQEYDEEKVKEQAQEMLEAAKVLDWLLEHSEISYITS